MLPGKHDHISADLLENSLVVSPRTPRKRPAYSVNAHHVESQGTFEFRVLRRKGLVALPCREPVVHPVGKALVSHDVGFMEDVVIGKNLAKRYVVRTIKQLVDDGNIFVIATEGKCDTLKKLSVKQLVAQIAAHSVVSNKLGQGIGGRKRALAITANSNRLEAGMLLNAAADGYLGVLTLGSPEKRLVHVGLDPVVAIYKANPGTLCVGKTRVASSRTPPVRLMDNMHARVPGGILIADDRALIVRPIVDNNDLEVVNRLCTNAVQALAQVCTCLIDGDDNADGRVSLHTCISHACPCPT